MKLTVLMENTACGESLAHAHGLSLYLETPRHHLLFDAGPDAGFAANAAALGVDLKGVDLAILSHGHYDHGGGLETFFAANPTAPVCLHEGAFGDYWADEPDGSQRYIGIDRELNAHSDRLAVTYGVVQIDEELTLFDGVEDGFGGASASASLKERLPDGAVRADDFRHEQDLLVTAEGKTLLIAGCAHRGIVNIKAKAEALLGREVDAVIGGFHLFQLPPGAPESDALIDRTGRALLEGETVYYTGHCTGEYAFARLQGILGRRLRRLSSGMTIEL